MKCIRCKDAPALRWSDEGLCGCCEVAVHQSMMADRPAAVPAHFNRGLGEYITDRTHLRKRRKELEAEGVIDAWD